jgi:hypothetical protein
MPAGSPGLDGITRATPEFHARAARGRKIWEAALAEQGEKVGRIYARRNRICGLLAILAGIVYPATHLSQVSSIGFQEVADAIVMFLFCATAAAVALFMLSYFVLPAPDIPAPEFNAAELDDQS